MNWTDHDRKMARCLHVDLGDAPQLPPQPNETFEDIMTDLDRAELAAISMDNARYRMEQLMGERGARDLQIDVLQASVDHHQRRARFWRGLAILAGAFALAVTVGVWTR